MSGRSLLRVAEAMKGGDYVTKQARVDPAVGFFEDHEAVLHRTVRERQQGEREHGAVGELIGGNRVLTLFRSQADRAATICWHVEQDPIELRNPRAELRVELLEAFRFLIPEPIEDDREPFASIAEFRPWREPRRAHDRGGVQVESAQTTQARDQLSGFLVRDPSTATQMRH